MADLTYRPVSKMKVGDPIQCTRHLGVVLLSKNMKRSGWRICDACRSVYKVRYMALDRAKRRATKPPHDKGDSDPSEVWKPIPAHPGYEASSAGRVRSLDRIDSLGRVAFGRVLAFYISKHGYTSCRVSNGGKAKSMKVSVLVAGAFLGPRPSGMHVAHSDGNKTNNRPENLRYATPKENEADKVLHGTQFIAAGARNGHSKFTEEDVKRVLERLKQGCKNVELERELGVSSSWVSMIKKGRRWKHVTRSE